MVRLFYRLIALLRGSIEWKPTSIHFLFRYPFWIWYANKHGLDLSCIDSSVIEVLHNFTKRAFRNAGGGGGVNCKMQSEGLGMLEVLIESMRRIIAGVATQDTRYNASKRKKLKQMYVKLATYTADKRLIIELAKGGTITESQRLWDLTFKNNLERMVIDQEDLKDILDLEEYMFIDIDGGDDSDINGGDEGNSDFSDDDDDNDESDQEKETIDLSPINLASTAQIAAQTNAAIQQATQERKDAASRVLVTKITITNDKKESVVLPLPLPSGKKRL